MEAITAFVDIGTLITRSADIHGGRPRISGSGVTVQRIAGWWKLGYDVEEISRKIPHLSRAQVHAALAYYFANRDQIERLIENETEEYDRFSAEYSNKAADVS